MVLSWRVVNPWSFSKSECYSDPTFINEIDYYILQILVFCSIFKFAIVLNFMTEIVHPHLVEFGYTSVEERLNLR